MARFGPGSSTTCPTRQAAEAQGIQLVRELVGSHIAAFVAHNSPEDEA